MPEENASPQRIHEGGDLILRQAFPLNGEPSLDRLVQAWLTPVPFFYIRNHGSIPAVDPESYRLRVKGEVRRVLELSLEELASFPRTVLPATLQCAGNRRGEHSRFRAVDGVPWNAGAVGNAEWGGIRLGDLLERAEVGSAARHVSFWGMDRGTGKLEGVRFAASIPIEKALRPETLIALQMNGEPLAPEHGFPVRALVPGFIAARSVKWLEKIVVGKEPADNEYQIRDYKIAPPEAPQDAVEWARLPALQHLSTSSVICSPAAGGKLKAGENRISGYALAAGHPDLTISCVEISADEGRSWVEAKLIPPVKAFTWTLWEGRLELRADASSVLTCRAWDSSGALQPQSVPWNVKGYMYNGWHRVPVEVG